MTYLQYAEAIDISDMEIYESRPSITPGNYKIIPHDILYIRVITPDPQWSEIFNPLTGGTMGAMTPESASLFGYPVNDDGFIEIPYVGKQKVVGKTIAQIKTALDSTFQGYVSNAVITCRLVNNHVTVIGEVARPGRYVLNKDRINVFEALSMAGDITEYGDRGNIQLIRPSQFGPMVNEFTLLDRSILSSEYFYVMPNDVIYAPPMKGRTFQMNASIYSIILTAVSTFFTLLVLTR
ncbi:MAG: polysaccharide biosynthesis/export family protein [Bacteroidales bacterium]|nr:polysaccharide biosynthesis/export family protein [Bacteroidales bacterium]